MQFKDHGDLMSYLWLYRSLSRFNILSFRAKVMMVAFLGTHVPLISLITWAAARTSQNFSDFLGTLSVALVATLVGTGMTLLALHHLLRPVTLVGRTLRIYAAERQIRPLPTLFKDEIGLLMRDATDTIQLLEAARVRLEEVDEQTGLGNRTRFVRQVTERLETGVPFAVAILVFDKYARIEQSARHQAAEETMRKLAERVSSHLGSGAALARVARDQLAFIFDDFDDGAAGGTRNIEILHDLVMVADTALHVAGLTFQPSLHAGVARAPTDGTTAVELIDCAATAAAPRDQRARVNLFTAAVRDAARDLLQLEEDLRAGLDRDELVLHFQPVVDIQDGRAVGAEALVRWQHPTKGLLPPGRFIPVAEKSGLITSIGNWVLDAACAHIAEWNKANLPGQKLAINLSAEQFHDAKLVDQVRAAIDTYKIAADQIEIELTESAANTDHTHTRTVFGRLRDLGVRIAIDDFGTGFASLSQLRRLPFDKLKIDREFVTDVHLRPDSQAICGALIALAEGLRIDILAEGTESAEEVRWLHNRGCRLFQGFGFAKPMPTAEYEACILSDHLSLRSAEFRTPQAA